MSKRDPDKKISYHTERVAGRYLFEDKEMDASKWLDMRTRITSENTMKALVFYGILKEGLECNSAGNIKDMIERMLIARGGKGRVEAVDILRQNFPRIREVSKGYEVLEDYTKKALKTVE
ncbi:hypothetical protein ES702_01942 [subsurface metagenome]